jgi:hypothetical protein
MNMNTFKRDYLPLIVAVLAAFVVSAIWYSPLLFGKQWIALRSQYMSVTPNAYIAPWKPLVELIREVTVAYVLSRFIKQLAIYRLRGALSLGFLVWVGLPITMLVGASLWDNKPWELSLIHGGDWLTKMLVMSAVIMFTRRLAFTSSEDFVREELPQQRAIRR